MKKQLFNILQSRWLIHIIVVTYFSLLTLAYTFPLAFHMADSIVGEKGDNIFFIWLIGWYQKAFFTLQVNPFFHPGLNFPAGWNLATTDVTPAMSLLGLPGSLLFGPIWGYNFAVLASFVLTGWCMYLAVRHLTTSSLAGIIAGTLFAFSPYRWARYLVGHLNLLGTFWFPIYFVAVAEFLVGDQRKWRWLLTAGLLALGIGLTAPYYLYMGLIITAIFNLALIIFSRRMLQLKRMFLRSAALFGLLLFVSLIAMLPYLITNSEGGITDRSLQYANFYSASPLDFILPVNFYLKESVWDWIGRSLGHENALYVGYVCLMLTILAWFKRRDLQLSSWIGAATVAGIAAAILAMGIYLRFQDTAWVWHIPKVLQPILGRVALRVPLPGYFLFQYLPLFSKMRVMMRFGIFTLTFTAIVAGLGSAWLFRKYSAHRYLIVMILLICIVLDLYPGVAERFTSIQARPVDIWLAAQPGNGAIVQFPFGQVEDQDQVYYTLIHGKPFIGGHFKDNPPAQYRMIKPVLDIFPDQTSVALLKDLKMKYILVDSKAYTDYTIIHQRIEEQGLILQIVARDIYVYTWP